MQKFSRLFQAAGVGVLALMASAASAAPITMSSTVDQSGFIGDQNLAIYPLTNAATPYDFTGQGYGAMSGITSITVTLTVSDGDTAPGDFDENSLTLGLDGIDTGLALNGFSNANIVSLDLSGNPALANLLLAALQSDGQLIGTILDSTPANAPQGDTIGLTSTIQTTLQIDGTVRDNGGGGNPVPLPAAVLIAPLGAGLAGAFARRFRKA